MANVVVCWRNWDGAASAEIAGMASNAIATSAMRDLESLLRMSLQRGRGKKRQEEIGQKEERD
jgi:hypothetical protein